MLQIFHLDVSTVDRVLLLPPRLLLPNLSVSSSLDAGDVRAAWGRTAWVGRVVRATLNPSERGVRYEAGTGSLHLDVCLGTDVEALA
jgi:hypothetical protein